MNLYTLEQVAVELGITSSDVADPARWVRDLIRKHGTDYKKCGRTVKLTKDQIRELDEARTCSDSSKTNLESGKSQEQSQSGETDNLIQGVFGNQTDTQYHRNVACVARWNVATSEQLRRMA